MINKIIQNNGRPLFTDLRRYSDSGQILTCKKRLILKKRYRSLAVVSPQTQLERIAKEAKGHTGLTETEILGNHKTLGRAQRQPRFSQSA